MIRKIIEKRKIRRANHSVEPYEIFLDAKNPQNFDRQQFEGRIEKPIPKRAAFFLAAFFVLAAAGFLFRLGYLQIRKGQAYFERSENNTLEKAVIFADRGIIYDRNRVELAWNKKADGDPSAAAADAEAEPDALNENNVPIRAYAPEAFSHLLGYVSYPAADKSGNYWQTDFVGKDGLEKEYNDRLNGVNGLKIVETDATGETHSENIVDAPKRGEDLVTSIDSRIQKELFEVIRSAAQGSNFTGGAGVIMDIKTGEIITAASYPEYNSEILSQGKDAAAIKSYMQDKRKVFLDRTISGLYTPGSIIKPFMALGALDTGVIDPATKILSTGSISIPNPYDKTKESVFKDWRAQGWVDMEQALAVSSDVYFYEVGGGYQSQPGMGIANIEKYANLFGIGEPTGADIPDEKQGIIPSPEWKAKNFPADPTWRVGDTYHTVIGQYGFQVTPMEMTRAVAAIANYGTLVTPHYLLGDKAEEAKTSTVDLPRADFDIVRAGMRQSVLVGTSGPLNVPYVEVASKSGTAQLGLAKDRDNSWIMGFFPYENPKYAFTLMMESGPASGAVSASSVMRSLLDWMDQNTPEYFQQ